MRQQSDLLVSAKLISTLFAKRFANHNKTQPHSDWYKYDSSTLFTEGKWSI